VAKDVHQAASNEAMVTITVDPDDPVGPPQISITDFSKREGRTGKTTTFTFTVSRTGDTSQAVTIDYLTSDGTATAGEDYVATSGLLTFDVGETTKTISVSVIGDVERESDETFHVLLTDEFGNELLGTGTIINDDK
jgi:hypothetical protein